LPSLWPPSRVALTAPLTGTFKADTTFPLTLQVILAGNVTRMELGVVPELLSRKVTGLPEEIVRVCGETPYIMVYVLKRIPSAFLNKTPFGY